MLQIKNLNKFYGKFQALKDVSFYIEPGSIFCLLGPNGSGKSTLVNCLLSLSKYTGQISYKNGNNFSGKETGIILEEDGFMRDMSAYKNLRVTSILKKEPISKINKLIDLVGLENHKYKRVKKMSQGMKKRLSIANSLIGNPEFLIWDEPYKAIDPDGFIFIRKLISDLNKQGKTILICTHLLDEVERIADHVGLIDEGQLLSVMSKKKIFEKFGSIENYYSFYKNKN
ncbi:MAG: ABC transporter ATP-binding protein [Bacteroidales bacterium]